MDLAGGERGGEIARDRPGAALVFTDREERDVAEQIVAGADHAIESRRLQAKVREEGGSIGRLELRDLELDLRTDGDRAGGGSREKRCQAGARRNRGHIVGDLRLIDIDDDQERLRGEKLKTAEPLEIVALQVQRAERTSVFESCPALCKNCLFALQIGRFSLLQIFVDALEPPLRQPEVRENQFVFHRLRVTRRIHRSGRMRDRRIVERAQNVNERVGILECGDVDERLAAPGLDGHRDIRELDGRRHAFFRVVHRGQAIETGVRHLRNADRRLAFAVRDARRLPNAGHELKESGFSGLAKSDKRRTQHGLNPAS